MVTPHPEKFPWKLAPADSPAVDGDGPGSGGPGSPGGLTILDAVVEYATVGGATIRAVDGVSLHVAPGQIVALLGASGSGKSSSRSRAGASRGTGTTWPPCPCTGAASG